MAITDYNTLAQKVGEYLNRTDTATLSQIPLYIAVAESNIYRDLRVPTMEARATYVIGDDTDSIRVPHNFLSLRSITIPEQNQVVRPKAWSEFTRERCVVPGTPEVYARDGDTFFFNPVPAANTEIQVLYYRVFDDLDPSNVVDDNDPRPFLSVSYDAWLYGALAEGATFLGDDRLSFFLQRYEGAIQSMNASASDLEMSGAMLEVSINSD